MRLESWRLESWRRKLPQLSAFEFGEFDDNPNSENSATFEYGGLPYFDRLLF
jgi:hypothetical protein